MTPLLFKSSAAQLNISKDSGLVMNPNEGEHQWYLKVFPFEVVESMQVVRLVHLVEFEIVEKQ